MTEDANKRHCRIVPQPVEMTMGDGCWLLGPDTVILHNDPSARKSAELVAAQLRPATGFALPVCVGEVAPCPVIMLAISGDVPPVTGSYTLKVTREGATITARTAAGLFYGGQTLRQLLPPQIFSHVIATADWKIPCVTIRDFPRYAWRGMHLDVSRHFQPLPDVLRFIDTIAGFKFNRFHWHLTDDQGWRVEIKKYPRLTEIGAWRKETLIGHGQQDPAGHVYDQKRHGGFYTQEEIRRVVEYAAERHITIIPEIDMPGHMQAAIAAYPELGSGTGPVEVRTIWGISSNVLNPKESTLRFCEDVLLEVLNLFPGEFIHVGGDEVDKTEWENSPEIQKLRDARGLKDMGGMQAWFLTRIQHFLHRNGRRMIGWDEVLEDGLDHRAVVMAWRNDDYGSAAAKAGYDVVMASRQLYFDYYQAEPVEKEPMAIGGLAPMEKVYGYKPVAAGLTAEQEQRILGAQGQLWTEYMPTPRHVEYMAFPRACALSETLWTPDSQKDYTDFLLHLPATLARLDCAGVNYRCPEERCGKG